jgi:Fic/DOC family
VEEIIAGANPGTLARSAHRDWYRELFQPSVAAGLIPPAALAGYRNDFVFLRTSRYVPPRWEAVRDAMPALFDLLESEPEPAVRAVLGHWLIGYIHPYMDGNGRRGIRRAYENRASGAAHAFRRRAARVRAVQAPTQSTTSAAGMGRAMK